MRKKSDKGMIDNTSNGSVIHPGPDLTKRVAVVIDKRTTIYARPGKEAAAKERYLRHMVQSLNQNHK